MGMDRKPFISFALVASAQLPASPSIFLAFSHAVLTVLIADWTLTTGLPSSLDLCNRYVCYRATSQKLTHEFWGLLCDFGQVIFLSDLQSPVDEIGLCKILIKSFPHILPLVPP